MRIERFALYPLDFPFVGGGYRTSYGRRTHLGNLLLAVSVEDGFSGIGEIARLTGASPLLTTPDAVARIAGRLKAYLGADPTAIGGALSAMSKDRDDEACGMACGLETACLDLSAKAGGLPAYAFLGGRRRSSIPTYFSIGQEEPATTGAHLPNARAQGYDVFQVKVGGNPDEDRVRIASVLDVLEDGETALFDANGGWDTETASSILADYGRDGVLFEEPCKTYDANRIVADRSGVRPVLDQCLRSLEEYARLCVDGFAAGAGLKPTLQGGPNAARTARDLCIAHEVSLKIDDSWCADPGTALALHLALGVPDPLLIAGLDMRLYFERRCGPGGPVLSSAELTPADASGLGLTVDFEALGPPVAEIR